MRYPPPPCPHVPTPRHPPPPRPGRATQAFELLHKLLTGGAALATLIRLLF